MIFPKTFELAVLICSQICKSLHNPQSVGGLEIKAWEEYR
jgi:hypothetical protein